jgi:hypothetical protein
MGDALQLHLPQLDEGHAPGWRQLGHALVTVAELVLHLFATTPARDWRPSSSTALAVDRPGPERAQLAGGRRQHTFTRAQVPGRVEV